MAKNESVVFRRIHGRIVPIRIDKLKVSASERRLELKSGAKYVAGGLAVAGAAGYARGESIKRFARNNRIFRFTKGIGSYGDAPAEVRFRALQGSSFLKSKGFKYGAKVAKTAGLLIGGAAIGLGITKITESITGRKLEEGKQIAINAGTAAATYGLYQGARLGFKTAKLKFLSKVF